MKRFGRDFLEEWIEEDANPFIIFNADGKIEYLNKEAQYLLSEVSIKDIFSICQTYAPMTYGFATINLDLHYGALKFYAVTIGYKNDEFIGIKLYNTPSKKLNPVSEDAQNTNVYLLLELCINASFTDSSVKVVNEFDPTFPELKLCINEFANTLNKIYRAYSKSTAIKTKLCLKTGEYIKYNGKKFPIFLIEIEGDKFDKEEIYALEKRSEEMNITVFVKSNTTTLKAPFVTD